MIVVVVAPLGEFRDGLTSLISVIPDINEVSTTEYLDRAIDYVEDHCPDLLITITDRLETTTLSKIKMMKVSCQQLKVIAFVQQPDMVAESISGDVDILLPQYAKANLITKAITSLLPDKQVIEENGDK